MALNHFRNYTREPERMSMRNPHEKSCGLSSFRISLWTKLGWLLTHLVAIWGHTHTQDFWYIKAKGFSCWSLRQLFFCQNAAPRGSPSRWWVIVYKKIVFSPKVNIVVRCVKSKQTLPWTRKTREKDKYKPKEFQWREKN